MNPIQSITLVGTLLIAGLLLGSGAKGADLSNGTSLKAQTTEQECTEVLGGTWSGGWCTYSLYRTEKPGTKP